ncbi:hypothetical protein BDV06DRAFT_202021 [Aspergillus oleicola]
MGRHACKNRRRGEEISGKRDLPLRYNDQQTRILRLRLCDESLDLRHFSPIIVVNRALAQVHENGSLLRYQWRGAQPQSIVSQSSHNSSQSCIFCSRLKQCITHILSSGCRACTAHAYHRLFAVILSVSVDDSKTAGIAEARSNVHIDSS